MRRSLWVVFLSLTVATVVLESMAPTSAARMEKPVRVDPQLEKPEAVRITIQKRPEPPPKTRPRKPPVAELSAPAPEPIRLEGGEFTPSPIQLVRGERLLEEVFPRLQATYERLGFPAYRDAVLALGGEFWLWDGSTNRPISRIDPKTGEMWKERMGSRLSRWPRDVTKHLRAALANGKRQYDERATHIVLLPPSRLDAALLGGLDYLLRQNGVPPNRVRGFYGAYELRAGRLHCTVMSVSLHDGTERNVSFTIDLSGAAL